MGRSPITDGRRRAISSLSREATNPYLSQLYAALEDEGVPRGADGRLDLHWLLDHRAEVRWLHAHWPEPLYHWHRGPARFRPALSWIKLALFVLRLRLARMLGYRIVWTIHQLYPHHSTQPRLDRAGARALAKRADVLLAHNTATADLARHDLGPGISRVTVVPHGSYVGVYPQGRSPDLVRSGLGIGAGVAMGLCFGELRSDSDIDVLLDAFAATELPMLRLVVAGNVKAASIAAALEAAVGRDERIVQLPGFVPFEAVAELYAAADWAVLPRGDGGTSGSLILALSLGVPVIAADTAANREIGVDDESGWLFEPGSRSSLAVALGEATAASPEERARKSEAAIASGVALDWPNSARTIVRTLTGIGG